MASSSHLFRALAVAMFGALAMAEQGEGKLSGSNYSAHGWLMWIAFGVLFPAGILMAKYAQKYSRWFLWHRILQIAGTLFGIVGLVLAFTAGEGDGEEGSIHVPLGFIAAGAVVAAIILGFIRPSKGGKLRPHWYASHWFVGIAIVALGWFNLYKGLDIVSASKTLYIALSIQLGIVLFIYLLLDRWEYFLTQSTSTSSSPELQLGVKIEPEP